MPVTDSDWRPVSAANCRSAAETAELRSAVPFDEARDDELRDGSVFEVFEERVLEAVDDFVDRDREAEDADFVDRDALVRDRPPESLP